MGTQGYAKLDLNKLKKAKKVVSMEEALKDVTPLDIPKDVLLGEREIEIVNVIPNKDTNRIQVEYR